MRTRTVYLPSFSEANTDEDQEQSFFSVSLKDEIQEDDDGDELIQSCDNS